MSRTARSKYYVQSVTDLSDGVLRCKAYGHSWEQGPVNRFSPVGREVWVVKLRCTSCPKVRTDYVEPGTFELDNRHYTKVPGFTVIDPTDKTDLREEAIRRQRARQLNRDVPVLSERQQSA
ncbi:hypothetical protein [Longimicrobium sp.]|jgi:hypothetical protein|uniref:hypothetical protein n=1 Tax=Longimicrobium sp. TaxID=2029185 RepID=UPI002EDA07CD